MIKKFKDLDIAVVCKTINDKQLERLEELCPVYKHINEDIECEVAIINYDTSIIEYITPRIWKENAKENQGIYQTIHGDYENPAYHWKPPTDKRIKAYIGITKHIVESFKRITDLENVILGYNPLTIDTQPLMLVSATRLSRVKGKDRMIKLANALDAAGIRYIWYVFTNDTNAIPSPNVIYMKPKLDVDKWLSHADYLVQLSDTEACSYSINEALYRNIPVIVTPLPYLKEIGVEDGKNAYIMEFDCSNIDDIVNKIQNVPNFEFKKLPDSYSKILFKSKSNYNDPSYFKKAIAIEDFSLSKFNKIKNLKRADINKSLYGWLYKGDIFECNEKLFRYLNGNNYKNKTVVEEYENTN
jgi:hypothetical protein